MATKTFDGFDHYNQLADVLQRSGWLQWQTPGGNVTASLVTGRNGRGKALSITCILDTSRLPIFPFRGVFADRNAEFFDGLCVRIPAGNSAIVAFGDSIGGNTQVTVVFDKTNYTVAAYRGQFGWSGASGGVFLGVSANNIWDGGVDNFFEFHLKVASSGGIIEVLGPDGTLLSLTGQNTQNTANAWADIMDLYANTTIIIDDFYYNDTTTGAGLVPANSYLGDSSTVTLPPIGNDAVTWTPFALSNWNEVSELAMDSDTSYNFTSTVGNEDRFNFQAITAALSTVYAVQVTGAYRKDDGGTRTIQQSVKSGSTEVYGASHNIPDTNYAYFTDMWVLNPATSLNWTLTDINAMKAGYKLVA